MLRSAAGSEAPLGSDPPGLESFEGSVPELLGTVVGFGKLGDPTLAGAAIAVVGAGGSLAGVTLGASTSGCFSESGAFLADVEAGSPGSPGSPPATRACAVCNAFGGS